MLRKPLGGSGSKELQPSSWRSSLKNCATLPKSQMDLYALLEKGQSPIKKSLSRSQMESPKLSTDAIKGLESPREELKKSDSKPFIIANASASMSSSRVFKPSDLAQSSVAERKALFERKEEPVVQLRQVEEKKADFRRLRVQTISEFNQSELQGKKAPTSARTLHVQRDYCSSCKLVAYPLDSIQNGLTVIHKACFKCAQCKRSLKVGECSAIDGKNYCLPHYKQLFLSRPSTPK